MDKQRCDPLPLAYDPLLLAYQVGKQIGRGTFGAVYRGHHLVSSHPVALKFVEVHRDEEDIPSEVEILRLFKHQAIARIIDYFPPALPSRKHGVIVFQQRETDLHHFVCRQRASEYFDPDVCGLRLDRSVTQKWARQIAQGLAELHKHCIIHRDLKPSNILLKWDALATSQGLSAEIADLGTAREMIADHKRRRITSKAEVDNRLGSMKRSSKGMTPHCGTEPFAAPEVWFGGYADDRNSYGYPADIWSYGTIVFEMLTLNHFVTGSEGMRTMVAQAVRRIGPFPNTGQRLGPRQVSLLEAAKKACMLCKLSSLDEVAEETPPPCAWRHLRHTLKWLPEDRSSVKALLAEAWLCPSVTTCVDVEDPSGASESSRGSDAQDHPPPVQERGASASSPCHTIKPKLRFWPWHRDSWCGRLRKFMRVLGPLQCAWSQTSQVDGEIAL